MYEAAAVAGLLAAGCRVTQLGIVSTPGVAVMASHLRAQGGLIITASHNPIQWNGLKPLICETSDNNPIAVATAPAATRVHSLIEAFHRNEPRYATVDQLLPAASDDSAAKVHTDAILKHIAPAALQSIRERKFKVVLDSVHGAGGREALALLDALGVQT